MFVQGSPYLNEPSWLVLVSTYGSIERGKRHQYETIITSLIFGSVSSEIFPSRPILG
jgi:hypothetical protein